MINNLARHFHAKAVDDIYINISHFLDHFIMLIFAKAAFDAGRHFGFTYDEIIVYGAVGFILFGGMAPIAAQLADRFSRSLMMVIFHFGIGFSAILAGLSKYYPTYYGHRSNRNFALFITPWALLCLLKVIKDWVSAWGKWGFGNMGVAAAPLITGLLLAIGDWRLCFSVPGLFCLAYGAFAKALRTMLAIRRSPCERGWCSQLKRALAALALFNSKRWLYFWSDDICRTALF